MHSKKIRKQKRKTRRGGFLNMRTPKSQKDNIKDWYLYWRKSFSYNDQYRYPGYFNLGVPPKDMRETNDVLYQSSDINNVPGCLTAVRSDRYENYKKPENIKKCGANLSGENEKYHKKYWKCNFPKFDNTIDWVDYTEKHPTNCQSVNQFKPVYRGDGKDLLPKDEDFSNIKF
jgi:hypothetical protein